MSKVVKRAGSDVIFTALNPEFLRRMAIIAGDSRRRHGTWDNYTTERYDEDRSCVSHAIDHLMHYLSGDKFDRFDGDVRWHLVAAGYNCMMHFYYHGKFGAEPSPWRPSDYYWCDSCKTGSIRTRIHVTPVEIVDFHMKTHPDCANPQQLRPVTREELNALNTRDWKKKATMSRGRK
jgi:hypothetical protein